MTSALPLSSSGACGRAGGFIGGAAVAGEWTAWPRIGDGRCVAERRFVRRRRAVSCACRPCRAPCRSRRQPVDGFAGRRPRRLRQRPARASSSLPALRPLWAPATSSLLRCTLVGLLLLGLLSAPGARARARVRARAESRETQRARIRRDSVRGRCQVLRLVEMLREQILLGGRKQLINDLVEPASA